jgi:hypothetical protein
VVFPTRIWRRSTFGSLRTGPGTPNPPIRTGKLRKKGRKEKERRHKSAHGVIEVEHTRSLKRNAIPSGCDGGSLGRGRMLYVATPWTVPIAGDQPSTNMFGHLDYLTTATHQLNADKINYLDRKLG